MDGLGFVHHQNGIPALVQILQQVIVQGMDHVQLGSALIDAQLVEDFLNELGYFKAGIGDQRQVISLAGQVLDQVTTQQGSPASNLPCQQEGPFPRLDAVEKATEPR